MLARLLTRLYSHLLKLFPDRFLDEFGGEMSDVFCQALTGLDDAGTPPATRRVEMARLLFREVWYFPLAYLDARRYQASEKVRFVKERDCYAYSSSLPRERKKMSWIGKHKRTWRMSLMVLLLLAAVGPWYIDEIHVPAEYECRNAIRLEGDFCGVPLPGIRIIPGFPIGMFISAVRLLTGETAFWQGVLELVGTCFFTLFFLPIFSSLLLSVKEGSQRWRQFHFAVLCFAVALGALYVISSFSRSALWGFWLYIGALVCALVLELLTWRQERTLTQREH